MCVIDLFIMDNSEQRSFYKALWKKKKIDKIKTFETYYREELDKQRSRKGFDTPSERLYPDLSPEEFKSKYSETYTNLIPNNLKDDEEGMLVSTKEKVDNFLSSNTLKKSNDDTFVPVIITETTYNGVSELKVVPTTENIDKVSIKKETIKLEEIVTSEIKEDIRLHTMTNSQYMKVFDLATGEKIINHEKLFTLLSEVYGIAFFDYIKPGITNNELESISDILLYSLEQILNRANELIVKYKVVGLPVDLMLERFPLFKIYFESISKLIHSMHNQNEFNQVKSHTAIYKAQSFIKENVSDKMLTKQHLSFLKKTCNDIYSLIDEFIRLMINKSSNIDNIYRDLKHKLTALFKTLGSTFDGIISIAMATESSTQSEHLPWTFKKVQPDTNSNKDVKFVIQPLQLSHKLDKHIAEGLLKNGESLNEIFTNLSDQNNVWKEVVELRDMDLIIFQYNYMKVLELARYPGKVHKMMTNIGELDEILEEIYNFLQDITHCFLSGSTKECNYKPGSLFDLKRVNIKNVAEYYSALRILVISMAELKDERLFMYSVKTIEKHLKIEEEEIKRIEVNMASLFLQRGSHVNILGLAVQLSPILIKSHADAYSNLKEISDEIINSIFRNPIEMQGLGVFLIFSLNYLKHIKLAGENSPKYTKSSEVKEDYMLSYIDSFLENLVTKSSSSKVEGKESLLNIQVSFKQKLLNFRFSKGYKSSMLDISKKVLNIDKNVEDTIEYLSRGVMKKLLEYIHIDHLSPTKEFEDSDLDTLFAVVYILYTLLERLCTNENTTESVKKHIMGAMNKKYIFETK